jgi:pSer/pThr/pTyr-binding forkhead associated (FHA) protein
MKVPPVIIVQLVHISGPLKGEIQEFAEGVITIGRKPSNNIMFPADFKSISRNHAEIIREGNIFRLVDHSANGTFVNGKRVQEGYLKDGDVLMFSDGGPKVSFLTQMKEGVAAVEPVVPPVTLTAPPPKPVKFTEEPKTPIQTKPAPIKEERIRPPVFAQPEFAQPNVQKPEPAVVQKTTVPLVIQYGPVIRSYKTVPVTIGKNPKCDFVLNHPAVQDQHIQIFFSGNQYCVKDLTGKGLVRINNRSVDFSAQLNVNDNIALSPQGPVLRYLGEGRFAENTEPVIEQPAASLRENTPPDRNAPQANEPKGFFAKFKKNLTK